MKIHRPLLLFFLLLIFILGTASAQVPVITSFSPASGPPGTTVIITGMGFNTTAGNNTVYFGAGKATVTAATATSLTVTMPNGATYAPITAINTGMGLQASSAKFYAPTQSTKNTLAATDFSAATHFNASVYSNSRTFLAASDLDGDGKTDIILPRPKSGSVIDVFRNTSTTGNPLFAAPVTLAGPGGTNLTTYAAVGDLDGDGKPDIVSANYILLGSGATPSICVYRNTSTAGNISFAAPMIINANNNIWGIAIGDIDGDGKAEIVTGDYTNAGISVFKNNSSAGSLSFAAQVSFGSGGGGNTHTVAIGDIDGDGKPDVVADNNGAGGVYIYRNASVAGMINASTFSSPVLFSAGGTPYASAIADINGDGKADVVTGNTSGNVSVFQNTAASGVINASSMAAAVTFALSGGSNNVNVGDFDGDGKIDILASPLDCQVLHNITPAGSNISTSSFEAGFSLSAGASITGALVTDVDGDGVGDVVVSEYGGSGFDVFRNQLVIGPLTQAANVTISNITTSSASINWTNGNGTSRAIFVKAASTGAAAPVNGQVYTANTAFSSGTQIGTTGWYCVYNGTGTTVNITGLSPGTAYQVSAVDYSIPVSPVLYSVAYGTNNPGSLTTQSGPSITANGTLTAFSTTSGAASTAQSFTVAGTSLTGNITVTAPSGFEVSSTSATSGFAGSVSLTPTSGTVATTTIYTRLSASATGTPSGNIILASTGATTQNVAVNGMVLSPAITITGTLTAFSACAGSSATPQSFTIAGSNLTANITVTAPTGFELSTTSGGTYSTSLSLTQASGAVSATTLYARMASAASSPAAGNITVASTGAASQTIAVSGTVNAIPSITLGTVASVNSISNAFSVPYSAATGSPDHYSITTGTRAMPGFIAVTNTALGSSPISVTIPLSVAGTYDFNLTVNNSSTGCVSAVMPLTLTVTDVAKVLTVNTPPTLVNNITVSGLFGYKILKFITGVNTVTLNGISIWVNNNSISTPTTVNATLWSGTSNSLVAPVAGGTITGLPVTAATFTKVSGTFASPITLSPNTNYYFLFTVGGSQNVNIGITTNASDLSYVTTDLTPISNVYRPASLPVASGSTLGINASGYIDVELLGTSVAPIDASLSSLAVSSGTLYPAFTSGTLAYTLSVANNVSSITVLPTPAQSGSTEKVQVNGGGYTSVANATASAALALNVGNNTVNVLSTASDGTTTKTYTLNVTRAASTDATLSGLTTTAGILSPVFAAGTTNYTATVPYLTTSTTVFPTSNQSGATIKVNNSPVLSASVSQNLPLNVGPNVITIALTAQDGTTTKTYTLTVTRVASPDATLSAFTTTAGSLSPVFASTTTSYASAVPNSTTNVTVSPTANQPGAAIKVNGIALVSGSTSLNLPLTVGPNQITTVVTAPDGITTQTYTLTITRPPSVSSIATLSGLTSTAGTISPAFAAATGNYSINVPNSVVSTTLTPTLTDATASVQVNGASVNNGAASASIPLAVGTNTITTVVTAQDGVTTQTYTLTINRPPSVSSIATLSGLTATAGTLSPAFAPATGNYSINVPNSVSSTIITPTLTDATASVTINGASVSNGTASAGIPLAVGSNTITTLVTAQDGVTTASYVLNIIRAPAGQSITFNTLPVSTYGNPDFSPAAISTNTGIPVTYSSDNTAVATIVNGNIHIIGQGTANIKASQAGNVSFSAAPDVTQQLIVNPATLTITADTKSKVYGAANPSLTVTYSGFVANDNVSILTVLPVVTTLATITSGAGIYAITPAGATAPNYTIVYSAGSLTINQAQLNITADDKSRLYGTGNPAFSVGYAGFVNGDTPNSLTLQPTAGTIASATSLPGKYAIIPSGGVSANYTFNYINGTLTILPLSNAALTTLILSAGAITPSFSTATLNYSANVAYNVSNLDVTASYNQVASATLNNSTLPNGSPLYSVPLSSGTNTLNIVVTAQDGITIRSYTLNIYRATPPEAVTATNVLSPNGDGTNDKWVIKDILLYPDNEVTVYDRGGREVYSKKGYDNSWDGTLRGAPLAEGTYFYVVKLGPYTKDIKGFITILNNH